LDEQVVAILPETDRDPVSVVAKRYGVSDQAIYTWRKRFGTFQADDVRRLKQLEAENARLKKLVVERDLRDRGDEGGRGKKFLACRPAVPRSPSPWVAAYRSGGPARCSVSPARRCTRP